MLTEKSPIPDFFRFTLIPTDRSVNSEIVLDNAPDGWQGMVSAWDRDNVYHGIYRTIETHLRFIREGAEWLRKEYNLHGVSATSQIKIEELNYDNMQYEVNFLGEFNFTQMSDYRNIVGGEDIVDMEVTEIGLVNMLRARENSIQEIPLTNGTTVNIVEAASATMSGRVDFRMNYQGTLYLYLFHDENNNVTGGDWGNLTTTGDTVAITTSPDASWLSAIARFPASGTSSNAQATVLNFNIANAGYLPSNYTMDVTLDVYVEKSETALPINFLHSVITKGGRRLIDGIPGTDSRTVTATLGGTNHQEDSIAIIFSHQNPTPFQDWADSLGVGYADAAYIYEQTGGKFDILITGHIDFTATSEPLLSPFSFPALNLKTVFQKLAEGIAPGMTVTTEVSGVNYSLSDFFNNTYLTSGDAIREITGAVLKTSFADFFNSIYAVYPISLTIKNNNILRIETYIEAYNANKRIVDLGVARTMNVTPAVDRLFNQITIGSADKDYNTVNGRLEFNTENVFSLPIGKISKEVKYIPKYRTDSFGVTEVKLRYKQNSTTTSDSDNDIFMIATVADINNARKPFGLPVSTTQILGDILQVKRKGVFNLYFTPFRCLRRHANILSSVLSRQSGSRKINFVSTAKTDAVLKSIGKDENYQTNEVLDNNGKPVYLNAAIYQAIWYPEIYEIEVEIPRGLINAMNNSNLKGGYMQFSFDGKIYKGFPISIRQEHWANPLKTIKLLAAVEPEPEPEPT